MSITRCELCNSPAKPEYGNIVCGRHKHVYYERRIAELEVQLDESGDRGMLEGLAFNETQIESNLPFYVSCLVVFSVGLFIGYLL